LENALKNEKVLPFEENELTYFIDLFAVKVKSDPKLKNFKIEIGYKEEIFKIVFLLHSMNKKLDVIVDQTKDKSNFLPGKELTVFHRISKNEIIGRENDLQELRKSLIRNNETALINGMGGIGKTTLAVVYVNEFYNEYEHIVWLTIETTIEEAVLSNAELIQNLNLAQIPSEQLFSSCFGKLRNFKNDKPNLLVLENAFDTIAGKYHYLPKAPNWHLLVTSREQISHFKIIELDFLSEEEAILLFEKYNSKFQETEIKQIVNSVELHTLTIEILARSSKENRWSFNKTIKAVTVDEKAFVSTDHSKDLKIERVKTYLGNIFKINNLNKNQIWILTQFLVFPNLWMKYEFLIQVLQIEKLTWNDEFASTLESLYKKGFLLKDETFMAS